MDHFWYLLSHGMLNVHSQDVHQRTVLFNLESFDACAGDFLTVLQLYEAIGGDLDHKDRDGNSWLMRYASDNLGMALVWAGASAFNPHKGVWKRGLSIAATRGFRGTMRAIVARDAPDQEFVDRSLNAAALQLSNDGHEQDMSGIRILVDVYGASVNRCGTLANCVHRNPFVVSALISLGAWWVAEHRTPSSGGDSLFHRISGLGSKSVARGMECAGRIRLHSHDDSPERED
ncbi:unnamed protein product [Ectocarpus sp. 8 AP-2014]